jgi:hypothetical protein
MPFEIVEATEELVNETFPPKPGGLVDRFRKKAAEEEARRDEEKNAAEPIEQRSYRAVKVAQQSPEVFAPTVYTILAGAYATILPLSPYRFRATILLTTPTVNAGNPAPAQPAVPATGVAQQNPNSYPVSVAVNANGATITNVSVNGITVGTAAGTYAVPAYGSISIAYTVATPTWVWSYAGAQTTTPATVILAKDSGNAISGLGTTLPYGIALPVNGRGMLVAYNPTGSTVLVSVLSELYAPE